VVSAMSSLLRWKGDGGGGTGGRTPFEWAGAPRVGESMLLDFFSQSPPRTAAAVPDAIKATFRIRMTHTVPVLSLVVVIEDHIE